MLTEVLKEMLLDLGFEVETAEDGMVALEAIQKAKFDYLVTDLKMKKMHGQELVSKARALNIEGLKIFAITGGTCDFEVDEKLYKPFVKDDLEKVLLRFPIARS